MPKSALNILFVVHALDAGGVSAVVRSLSAHYAEEGHRVTVLSLSQLEQGEEFYSQSIKVETLPVKFKGQIGLLLSFFALIPYFIKNRDFDVVFVPGVVNALITLPVLKLIFKIPPKTIVNAHTAFSVYYKSQRFLKQRILDLAKFALPMAHILANDSKGAAQDLKDHFKLRKDVHAVYNPIADDASLNYNAPKTQAPHPWLTDENLTTFVGCGRLVPLKNFSHMIEVFAKLYEHNKDVRLIIIGKGPEEGSLKKKILNLNLEDVIELAGFVDDPKEYFYHADYVWLTSLFEGFSVVLGEALSMGTPCIANDCPFGPRNVLENGKYGLLLETYNTEKNADEILKFLQGSKQDRDFYRTRAHDFHVKTVACHYLELTGFADDSE